MSICVIYELLKEKLKKGDKMRISKYQIAPSKAVVGVDRPMKAPSMHVQMPY